MKTHFQLTKIATALAVIGGVSVFSGQAMAATPLAGTNISNVATASYVDNTGTERTVTSNEVKTIVAQVGSFTLVSDRQAETTPNGKVEMHHVLTNTGNGTDTFTFDLQNLAGGSFDFESGKFAVYLDKNLDGIPDDNVNLADPAKKTAVELKAGDSVGLIVVATTPNTAQAGNLDKLKLTATAGSKHLYITGKDVAENTDTVTITSGAVISLTKAASINSAKVGDIIEYTLTFKNTGNATATNVAIFDVLPDYVKYEKNSARYSRSTTALTDENTDGDNYQFNNEKRTLLLNIPSLAANTTATLKFKVTVLATAKNTVDNIAYVDPDGKPSNDPDKPNVPLTIDDATPPTTITPNGPTPSNESKVPVLGVFNGALNDSLLDSFKDGEKPVAAGAIGDDLISVAAKQGVPIEFGGLNAAEGDKIVVHNKGNSTDTFNLTADKSGLPAGSIIEILKSDGRTPAVDTNGDGIVDTGPIAADEKLEFVVRITLPNGTVIEDGQVLSTTLTSTSLNTLVGADDDGKDTLKLEITSMSANKVDLVNKPDAATENGTGSNSSVGVEKQTTPPGTPVTFDTTIKNNGNVSDNYVITVPDVPKDWKVEIFEKNADGSCSSTKVTNSGNIKQGEAKSFCVTVTPPAGTPAGTQKDITVEIKSPATGTSDSIIYPVEVEEKRSLVFTPDRQGQVAPGGTVEYVHTLTNMGNVVEGGAAVKADPSKTAYKYDLELDWTSTMAGVNTSIYVDLNGNGTAETNELVSGANAEDLNKNLNVLLQSTNGADGLSPNESIQIIVKVQTPATATAGEKDTTILTFKPTGEGASGPVSITDLTTINLGQVRLSKTQAKADVCGTVPAEAAFGIANITAKPGECVYYRVTAINDGNEDATDVKISDMVPSYTTYVNNSVKPATATASNNKVEYNVGTLTPAATATLEFAVKVDQ